MATSIKDKLASKIPALRKEKAEILKKFGDRKISEVVVSQAFGGMRGIKGMICDTSLVSPDKGLIIRGIPIAKLTERYPEEVFWLLITGQLPTKAEFEQFSKELKTRNEVPGYIWKVLKAMPKSSHPMAMLNTAILAMENESVFRKEYSKGLTKDKYWEATLEDSMKLLATVHTIAAGVYRMKYKKGPLIAPSKKLHMGADYIKMLGLNPRKGDTAMMMRLYLVLHSDHEGGNVSANACHTVGSALSDPYYAATAGLNGLAGPLHGLANQECLKWIIETMEQYGGCPTEKQIEDHAWETLNAGKVIPGYGHAVLRVTDPRYKALHDFGIKHLKDDEIFKTVDRVFRVVPKVLKEHGKAASVWPNVDAGSGSILYFYGLKEFEYYTVVFAVSRMMGMLAQLVVNRALGSPLTRPKSVSTAWIKNHVK